MLLERGIPLTGIYTSAAPRVGDKKFDKAMSKAVAIAGARNWRIVNEGDIVPHLPPEPWFSHAGERRLLRYDGSQSDKIGIWNEFKEKTANFLSKIKRSIIIADVHRLNTKEGYIKQIEGQLKN